jgi:hypothetical protein
MQLVIMVAPDVVGTQKRAGGDSSRTTPPALREKSLCASALLLVYRPRTSERQ